MTKPILFLAFVLSIVSCNPQKRSAEWDRENVVTVKDGDSRYVDAYKLAQENMPTFVDMFDKRKKNGCKFNVSARYREGKRVETMWFTVLSIDKDTLNTELNNVPFNLKTIALGDKMKIPKDSVRDWVVSKHHKVVAGNFANEDF